MASIIKLVLDDSTLLSKIELIKSVRKAFEGIGLKEAKDIVCGGLVIDDYDGQYKAWERVMPRLVSVVSQEQFKGHVTITVEKHVRIQMPVEFFNIRNEFAA